jgi:hypothetical protein
MGIPDKTLKEIIDGDLPVIRIVREWDEAYVGMELEMEDSTKETMVAWGKEVATDDDYVSIALREGLEAYLASIDAERDDNEGLENKEGDENNDN